MYNIDPMFLKICIGVHILIHLYAKKMSLEVYKSNINSGYV